MASIDWLAIETFDGRPAPVLLWWKAGELPGLPILAVHRGEWTVHTYGAYGGAYIIDRLGGAPTHWAAVEGPMQPGGLVSLGGGGGYIVGKRYPKAT